MRATSPLDALAASETAATLPLPKYPIGTRLDLSKIASYNVGYYQKAVRQTLIRRLRHILNSLQRQGFLAEMKGKKMLEFHKQALRAKFEFMRTADSVEVAGHLPHGVHVSGYIANDCYLVGGAGFSGVTYKYCLLFRKVDSEGRRLVFLYPEALLDESEIRLCAIL